MNYKLSIVVNRPLGKSGFSIEVGGKIQEQKIYKIKSQNIKEEALRVLEAGLLACKIYVEHHDLMIIEVQNSHLQQWLDGEVEYKDYITSLDKVFRVLEGIDCRYRFVFNPKPNFKSILDKEEKTQIQGTGIADIMKGM